MADIETQMIQAARKGETEGYKYLMDRYGRRVQLQIAQMVADLRNVEELTQDVFVRAFAHLQDYDPAHASFGTWLGRIAHNTALNHLRRPGLPMQSLDSGRCTEASSWIQEDNFEAERLSLLDDAIGRLCPEERSLLHLRYYESLSLGEIAEIMKVKAGPLTSRLQRIRKKLMKLITS